VPVLRSDDRTFLIFLLVPPISPSRIGPGHLAGSPRARVRLIWTNLSRPLDAPSCGVKKPGNDRHRSTDAAPSAWDQCRSCRSAEPVTSNPPLLRTQGWGNHGFRLYPKGGPAPLRSPAWSVLRPAEGAGGVYNHRLSRIPSVSTSAVLCQWPTFFRPALKIRPRSSSCRSRTESTIFSLAHN
jgi:hypothetical protein